MRKIISVVLLVVVLSFSLVTLAPKAQAQSLGIVNIQAQINELLVQLQLLQEAFALWKANRQTETVTAGTDNTDSVTLKSDLPLMFAEDFVDPASYDRFEKVSWHRDPYVGTRQGFAADHAPVAGGSDPDKCTNPFTTRFIAFNESLLNSGEGHVYRCAPGDDTAKAHIMAAQAAQTGYDFTAFWTKDSFENVTEVSWEQNITHLGGGNWSEVAIVPVRTWNPVQPPCSITWVECWTAAEGGTDGVVRSHADMNSVGMSWFNVAPGIFSATAEDTAEWDFRSDVPGSIYQQAEAQFSAFSSPAPRFTHTLRDNGDGTISLLIDTKLADWGVYEIGPIAGSFPDEPSVVVFSVHNYENERDYAEYIGDTWHWDNIEVR